MFYERRAFILYSFRDDTTDIPTLLYKPLECTPLDKMSAYPLSTTHSGGDSSTISSTISLSSSSCGGFNLAAVPGASLELAAMSRQIQSRVRGRFYDHDDLPLPPNFYKTWEEFCKAGDKFKGEIEKELNFIKEEVRKFTVKCALTGRDPAFEFQGTERTAIEEINEALDGIIKYINEVIEAKQTSTKGPLPLKIKDFNSEILKKIHAI